jgi:hypothetical protein
VGLRRLTTPDGEVGGLQWWSAPVANHRIKNFRVVGGYNMRRRYGKSMVVGIMGLVLLTTGCASEMFKKAGAEAASGKINEVGLIISQHAFLPAETDVQANEVVRIWIVNTDKDPVQVMLNAEKHISADVKSGQIISLDLQNPELGSVEIRCAGKSGESGKAVLNISRQVQNTQVAIIRDFQAFFPIKTRVKAQAPLKVYTATVSWAPHGDFVIYGTDVKLPFVNGEVGRFEIQDGLKAGIYPISRTNYPRQNHGIKSLISAEQKSAE